MKKSKTNLLLQVVLGGIAFIYALAFLKIIILKNGWSTDLRYLQLVPFQFIRDFGAEGAMIDVWIKNVAGNIAMFVPLSILIPCFFKKITFGKTVLLGAGISLGVEVLQYIVGVGCTDIDDLILNTLGALLGAVLYFGLFHKAKKWSLLVSALFLSVFGCCGVLALWLYQPNMVPMQIVYNNEEVLGETTRDSFDVDAVCTGLDDTTIYLSEGSVIKNDTEGTPVGVKSYPLAKDATIICEEKSYTYSPNGNIQKMDISYVKADVQSVQNNLTESEDGEFISIWLNDAGECEKVIFTVYVK